MTKEKLIVFVVCTDRKMKYKTNMAKRQNIKAYFITRHNYCVQCLRFVSFDLNFKKKWENYTNVRSFIKYLRMEMFGNEGKKRREMQMKENKKGK